MLVLVRNGWLLLMDWNYKELFVLICSGWASEKNKFLLSMGSLTNLANAKSRQALENAKSD